MNDRSEPPLTLVSLPIYPSLSPSLSSLLPYARISVSAYVCAWRLSNKNSNERGEMGRNGEAEREKHGWMKGESSSRCSNRSTATWLYVANAARCIRRRAHYETTGLDRETYPTSNPWQALQLGTRPAVQTVPGVLRETHCLRISIFRAMVFRRFPSLLFLPSPPPYFTPLSLSFCHRLPVLFFLPFLLSFFFSSRFVLARFVSLLCF